MLLCVKTMFYLHSRLFTTITVETHGNAIINTTSEIQKLSKQRLLKDNGDGGSSKYISLLQASIGKNSLMQVKYTHAYINHTGFVPDMIVHNTLLNMYVKCGRLQDARQVFDRMPERDVCSWTVVIAGYAKHGLAGEAMMLFQQMQGASLEANQFTFASLLSACASSASLDRGMEIHEHILRQGLHSDIVLATALIDMYTKCASIENARKLFDKMDQHDMVSCNAMIAGYAQNELVGEALNLFHKMPQRDVFSWTSMIAGFAQNGFVNDAQKLFDKMPQRTVVSWNAMIAGLAQNGQVDKALNLFQQMPKRDAYSWTAMIAGYAQNGLVWEAYKLFEEMPERQVVSWNSMISGFAQNGLVEEALKLFQEMPQRDIVSWNAMIAGYAQNGHGEETLELFKQMELAGVRPDSKTFVAILPVCANLAALEQGMEIHDKIRKSGLQSDILVTNALIDMYAKCGSIEKARSLFDKMHQPDVVSWTAMIAGYAMHGCAKEALKLFEQMNHTGINPNHVTLVSVLSACSHAGLVDEGYQYFTFMSDNYHTTPTMEHYRCMVDLLGRAGRLDEAKNFINEMPVKPDAVVWSCLLGACRIHNNIELGEWVAEHVLKLDPNNAASYVLLSNMYAAAGRWGDVEKLRKKMKDKDIKKTPGCSWIEVDKTVHTFLVGNRSHPQIQKIYTELHRLSLEMKLAGYVPDTRFVLNDVKEEEKEHILWHHSEKLAIAFGLLNTSPGTTIRVIKNLRVCGDCHSATKFISKIVAREIILRDVNHYHHFKDGQCSCGDIW